jgi:D-arabinose 1-dehydrogenase-like Zn-dependent alcohol dehydrogenase
VRKKIRAAVFEEIQKVVYRKYYPKPVPGPDDVLVKVNKFLDLNNRNFIKIIIKI